LDIASLPEGSVVGPPASAQAIAAAAAALPAAMPEELAAFLALANGVTANTFAIYSCEALGERNATYEVGVYAPGFVTFGDDGGGCALMLRGGPGASPVYLVDHGSMSPECMEELAPSFAAWIASGCRL
jgi:streptogramin lyase